MSIFAGSAIKKQSYVIVEKEKKKLPKKKNVVLNYSNYDRGLSSDWFQAVI